MTAQVLSRDFAYLYFKATKKTRTGGLGLRVVHLSPQIAQRASGLQDWTVKEPSTAGVPITTTTTTLGSEPGQHVVGLGFYAGKALFVKANSNTCGMSAVRSHDPHLNPVK